MGECSHEMGSYPAHNCPWCALSEIRSQLAAVTKERDELQRDVDHMRPALKWCRNHTPDPDPHGIAAHANAALAAIRAQDKTLVHGNRDPSPGLAPSHAVTASSALQASQPADDTKEPSSIRVQEEKPALETAWLIERNNVHLCAGHNARGDICWVDFSDSLAWRFATKDAADAIIKERRLTQVAFASEHSWLAIRAQEEKPFWHGRGTLDSPCDVCGAKFGEKCHDVRAQEEKPKSPKNEEPIRAPECTCPHEGRSGRTGYDPNCPKHGCEGEK